MNLVRENGLQSLHGTSRERVDKWCKLGTMPIFDTWSHGGIIGRRRFPSLPKLRPFKDTLSLCAQICLFHKIITLNCEQMLTVLLFSHIDSIFHSQSFTILLRVPYPWGISSRWTVCCLRGEKTRTHTYFTKTKWKIDSQHRRFFFFTSLMAAFVFAFADGFWRLKWF